MRKLLLAAVATTGVFALAMPSVSAVPLGAAAGIHAALVQSMMTNVDYHWHHQHWHHRHWHHNHWHYWN